MNVSDRSSFNLFFASDNLESISELDSFQKQKLAQKIYFSLKLLISKIFKSQRNKRCVEFFVDVAGEFAIDKHF